MKFKKSRNVLLFIFLSFLIFPNFAWGQIYQTVYPTKDAFVSTFYPDDNTGIDPWLWVSNDPVSPYETCISFIYYELPYDYSEYGLINFHFYIVLSVSDSSFNIQIHRITQNWEELTLTWNNSPLLGDLLLKTELESHRIYDINVKDYLISDIFSICIVASEVQNNLGQIPSSECDWYSEDKRPAIILIDIVPIITGSVVGVIVVAGIGYFLYKRRKARKTAPSDSSV